MQFTFGIAYTLLYVFLLVFHTFRGYREGLLSGLLGLVGSVAGFVLAGNFSNQWSVSIYNNFLGKVIGDKVTETLAANNGNISAALQQLEFLPEALRHRIEMVINNLQTGMNLSEQVVAAVQPVVVPLLQVVLFLVIFGVVSLLVRSICVATRVVNGVPLLGAANKLLGFCFGLVDGALRCWLLTMLLWSIARVSGDSLTWLNSTVLATSPIYGFLAKYNPLLTHY